MGLATTAYRRVEPARLEQRAVPRQSVLVKGASVSRAGRKPITAELEDISVYGCRLAIADNFAEGDRLSLRLPAGEMIRASVIWHRDGKLGCRFDSRLDRSVFRSLTLMRG
ncbi:MAG: hypothetical protein RIS00_560 [Pseudomonadota bacterium]|jgi:hypothetical protein